MKINEIKITRAIGWNDGKPGGAEYWVIAIYGNNEQTWLTDSVEYLANWLRENL